LAYAAAYGQIEIVQLLLQHGASVNRVAFMGAANGGDERIMELFLNRISDPSDKNHALIDAIHKNHEQIIKLLLSSGADPNSVPALREAVKDRNEEIVRLLLNNNADVNLQDEEGNTPIFVAYPEKMIQLLIDVGAHITWRGKNGETALIYQILHSHAGPKRVKTLIDAGVDVYAKDDSGKTAIDYAKSSYYSKVNEKVEVLKLLESAVSGNDPGRSSSPVSAEIEEVGGIDLNKIKVGRQGAGVDIQFDPVELQNIIDLGITGFAPVIINITPLPSVLPLLGLAPREEEYELSSLN